MIGRPEGLVQIDLSGVSFPLRVTWCKSFRFTKHVTNDGWGRGPTAYAANFRAASHLRELARTPAKFFLEVIGPEDTMRPWRLRAVGNRLSRRRCRWCRGGPL